jgi:hypothetical protein
LGLVVGKPKSQDGKSLFWVKTFFAQGEFMKHTTKSAILWLSAIITVIAITSGCGDKSDPLGTNPIYGNPIEEIIETTEEAPPADNGEDGDPTEEIIETTEEAPPADNGEDSDPTEEIAEPSEEPDPPTNEEPIEMVPLFDTLTALGLWLKTQPPNTAETPYKITLIASGISNLNTTLAAAPDKYVHIDFTGNTMTTIPSNFLQRCDTLAGLTIPDNVTKIESYAFYDCGNLTTVIFEGVITINNFSSICTFSGDLRTKYFIGSKGKYTRTTGSAWSKQ